MSGSREFGTYTPQRFKCISIIGSSNGATQLSALGAVSSLGRVRFRGGSTDNISAPVSSTVSQLVAFHTPSVDNDTEVHRLKKLHCNGIKSICNKRRGPVIHVCGIASELSQRLAHCRSVCCLMGDFGLLKHHKDGE